MARRNVWTTLAGAALAGLGGCGTVLNLSEQRAVPVDQPPRQVYGGVKIVEKFGEQHRREASKNDDDNLVNAALWVAAVIDLPLSALGDTLTLPLVLYWQSQQPKSDAPPTASTSANSSDAPPPTVWQPAGSR